MSCSGCSHVGTDSGQFHLLPTTPASTTRSAVGYPSRRGQGLHDCILLLLRDLRESQRTGRPRRARRTEVHAPLQDHAELGAYGRASAFDEEYSPHSAARRCHSPVEREVRCEVRATAGRREYARRRTRTPTAQPRRLREGAQGLPTRHVPVVSPQCPTNLRVQSSRATQRSGRISARCTTSCSSRTCCGSSSRTASSRSSTSRSRSGRAARRSRSSSRR